VDKGQTREVIHFKPVGPLDCSDGQVLHDWCLAGYGIAWRSTWEVEAEISAQDSPGSRVGRFCCATQWHLSSCFHSASTCRCACGYGSTTSSSNFSTAGILANAIKIAARWVYLTGLVVYFA
jgi:hypothetical protein